MQAGPLLVEPARRQARLGDREIELTAHEFELLYVLAGNRGIVFSRDALVQKVWGEDTHITVRSVDTLVKRLRRKLEGTRRILNTSLLSGDPATSSPMPESIWFRSLYWRIAIGFVAMLAVVLMLQALFLWLTGRFAESNRTPQQLADEVARDLSDVLTEVGARPRTPRS